jgi:beta-glucosidase
MNDSSPTAAAHSYAAAGMLIGLLVASCSDSSTQPPAVVAKTEPSVAHPDQWPAVARPAFGDDRIEDRITQLLDAMTLEAKVGQVIQADIGTVTPADVREYRLGSVLSGGNSGPGGRDVTPAPRWLALADEFYDASMAAGGDGPAIPLLWGIDAVHGHNNIIGATLFPQNIALGATRNPELLRRIGEITAREVRVTGQDWTFAPTLAVVRDDRWGRTYESYSEDPEIVGSLAAAMIEGLQGKPGSAGFLRGEHVIATAKHFLGDGGTLEGRDQGDNRSTESELRDIHAAGYVAGMRTGVQTVMASYSSWQGVKMHGHAGLLTGVLKGRMGFDGLVVGDWNGHGQVEGCSNLSCARSFNAGVDMFMAPDSWKGLYANTLAQVRSGEIALARLDDAVRRILRVKLRAGLFEAGRPSARPPAGRFELLGAAEHRAVARTAVRESLVLLKNEGHLLPLRTKQRVLVAGDGADNVSKQSGGWTLTWQGTDLKSRDFPGAQSIHDGIRAAVTKGGGTVELNSAGTYKVRPDVAVVVFGEDPYAEFQGDIATLEYRPGDKRDLELMKRLGEQGIPVVAVFLSGRPLWVNPEINASKAFVAAWLPGSEGGGIADVLFRKPDGSVGHDFKGKLSFSWPRTPLQFAANRGADGEPPQFEFGYGLTYADAGDLAPLPVNVPREIPSAVDSRTFYSAGQPGKGWRLFTQEADGKRFDLAGARPAIDRAVFLVTSEDRHAEGDVHSLRWSGQGDASFGLAGDTPIDLQRESNGELSLAVEYRVTRPPTAEVMLSMQCGENCGGSIPIAAELRRASAGEWQKLRIFLSCFERAGAGMRSITTPFMISTAGELGLSLAVVRLETGVENTMRCTP